MNEKLQEHIKKCRACNKNFIKRNGQSLKNFEKQSFCSNKCRASQIKNKRYEDFYGLEKTSQMKQKMSLIKKGKPSPRLGHTKENDESVKRMALKRIGKKNWMFYRKKDLSPNWKGGITPLKRAIRTCFEYRQWRSDIFTRDNYICKLCGVRGKKLNADHIKPFSKIIYENNVRTMEEAVTCEELWNINNGRTLCVTCHRETDTFGYQKIKYA